MVSPAGLEPAASSLGNLRSIQMSYEDLVIIQQKLKNYDLSDVLYINTNIIISSNFL